MLNLRIAALLCNDAFILSYSFTRTNTKPYNFFPKEFLINLNLYFT